MKPQSLFFIFITFFLHTAYAQIHQAMTLRQTENQIEFQIQIQNQNQENVLFQISPDAIFQDWLGISSPQMVNQKWQFSVPAHSNAELSYILVVENKKNYFIAGSLNWTPQVISHLFLSTPQTYEVLQTQIRPEFQLIHSATGKNQDSFDFVLCQCFQYQNADGRLRLYLQKPEDTLANTLLEYLEKYLKHYETEIGTYPYDQFAVIESPNEIGYAFPKMTWIGSQLLHFPFILKSSLPHELLHSWWGNGVFINYNKGNWCEGLTSFGSDYQFLTGDEKKLYRLKAITSYLDYVHQGNDLPLSQFQSRGEDRGLQAIGYDKAMMVFQMLEKIIGEQDIKASLQSFYQKFQNQSASYDDLLQIMQEKSTIPLKQFKNFWIYSTGILPRDFLTVTYYEQTKILHINPLKLEFSKIPNFKIELLLKDENGNTVPLELKIKTDGSGLEQDNFKLSSIPRSYALDPNFQLFRSLDENEKPLTYSSAFAAEKIHVFSTKPDFIIAAKTAFPNVEFINLNSLPDLNTHQTIFLTTETLPQFPELLTELQKKEVEVGTNHFILNGRHYSQDSHSLALAFKIKNSRVFLLSLASTQPLLRWLQRWQHYGAKNYLVLSSTKAEDQGVWIEPYFQNIHFN